MRTAIFIGAGLCVLAAAAAEPGTVSGAGDRAPAGYVPPLLSNGDISLQVDWTCGMRDRDYAGLTPAIYWEGRRSVEPGLHLFEFGRFDTRLAVDGEQQDYPVAWTQRLDVARAASCHENAYAGGITVRAEAFVALTRNVVAVRETVGSRAAVPRRVDLALVYHAPRRDARLVGAWAGPGFYTCRSYGRKVLDAAVAFCPGAGENAAATEDGQAVSLGHALTLAPGEKKTFTWFLVFADTLEGAEATPESRVRSGVADLMEIGFEGLRKEHEKAWADYYGESSVRVPDAKIQRMADVANYHLRCVTTRWSLPVGIFPSHWQGRYFASDETYAHDGLLAAGHFAAARRVTDYRAATLPTAVQRMRHVSGYGMDAGRTGARWFWEATEDGLTEGAPQGFWLDHIMQQATVARSVWEQYLYDGDLGYLRRTGYPVLLECARYYRANCVYDAPDGSAFIGKCTDLERLGPAVERPFMSTCGAVYAMRAAADAADLLGADAAEAAGFRRTADRLMRGLPRRGDRYLACAGCDQDSVGTLAGLYPFPVFRTDDALAKATALRFVREGRANGNMYPMGRGICSWYSAWVAITMNLLGDDVEPGRCLAEAASTTGLFGELFEINEPGTVVKHPWFSTASGNCLAALNATLLCAADGELRLACGVPEGWKDFAFRLPAPGGVEVEAEVRGGALVRLVLTPRPGAAARKVRLVCPARFVKDRARAPWAGAIEKDGRLSAEVVVGGS